MRDKQDQPTVFDVAKYILVQTKEITTFKLQKLVYYAQAWSLVWDDATLFDNEIEAWANGPVCRSLYEKHKGQFTIKSNDVCGDENRLSRQQQETIDAVIRSYGQFSGQELSDLTHKERPWVVARAGMEIGERGDKVIELNTMCEYYSALHLEQQSEN